MPECQQHSQSSTESVVNNHLIKGNSSKPSENTIPCGSNEDEEGIPSRKRSQAKAKLVLRIDQQRSKID
jgi:hypothetical protein